MTPIILEVDGIAISVVPEKYESGDIENVKQKFL